MPEPLFAADLLNIGGYSYDYDNLSFILEGIFCFFRIGTGVAGTKWYDIIGVNWFGQGEDEVRVDAK